jgi:hypothetical protein
MAGYHRLHLRTRSFVLHMALSLSLRLLSFPLSLPCVSRLSIVSRTSLRVLFCFPYFAGRFLGAKLSERGIFFSL